MALLAALFGGMAIGLAGCHAIDFDGPALDEPIPQELVMPREKVPVSLPTYRIEPPDVLGIEVLKLIPRPPYRAQAHDVLQIQAAGTLLEEPIDGLFLIQPEGTVALGPTYGSVRVVGMTTDEIEVAILEHLKNFLRGPLVSVQLARAAGTQEITGQYLVGPDGRIDLRRYGSLHVAGRTIAEAKEALEKHLAQYFDTPKAAVNVLAYNSKVYYVIAEGAGTGDVVVRLPITGKETVLDAISNVGGLTQMSSKNIWVARPAPGSYDCEQILPVDWDAIARSGITETNYQLMPGDRVFIAGDPTMALSNYLGKLSAPIERLLGMGGLVASNVRGWQMMGRGYNRSFRRY
jgi:polysaccharide export outer membrane protein